MKHCSRCEQHLPASAFSRRSNRVDGLMSWCSSCNTEHMRRWRAENPDKARATGRRDHLRRKYGITPEEYDRLLAEQGGGCAICGTTDPGSPAFNVDHNHACCPTEKTCGKCVRALLCRACNTLLGNARDDAERLRAAAAYLEEHEYTRRRAPNIVH